MQQVEIFAAEAGARNGVERDALALRAGASRDARLAPPAAARAAHRGSRRATLLTPSVRIVPGLVVETSSPAR